MATDRNVQPFHERARTYESDWRGKMHREIASRTADVSLGVVGSPKRVLDVGCGTGLLLRILAERVPDGQELAGIDPAEGMIDVARSLSTDPRLQLSTGWAEDLPYPEESFDLVVSTTSFDHWDNQMAGLRECARVLAPGGTFVLTDLFSWLLAPTLVLGRRGRARTRRRAASLLDAAGFGAVTWRRIYPPFIAAAVASR